MNPKQWQQAKELFEVALKRPLQERAVFLDEQCNGDDELRREVESLLANADEAASFLETPAVGEVAETIFKQKDNQLINRNFSHYQIISQIGAGGMGEVFLAEDLRLHRKVALKLLPENIAADKDRLRRFEQEAFAASALNHPNILTIYEFGTENGVHYLASEFVEGETLRGHLQTGEPLSINQILDIAVQTASALATAHEAKIIHRDIKPENIMIRRDHLVKVLDFGLAKLTERKAEISVDEAETKALVNTAPGMVMGTVSYMSPEQARGRATDARSDIWSLGVVLYEMIVGVNPFGGETVADSIAAVINKKPAPLALARKDAPDKLEDIVSKCLEKDADERYQTIKDLLVDLRRLKKRLEFQAEMEYSETPEKSDELDNTALNQTQVLPAAIAQTGAVQFHTTSSTEVFKSEIKRHKTGFIVGLSVIVLLAAAGIFGLYKFVSQSPPVPQINQNNSRDFDKMKITKLTDTGKTGNAAISPDGKYVVHTQVDGTKQSLWIRHVATDSNVQIILPAEVFYWRMTFSPDGNFIYFWRWEKTEKEALYRIPVLGGEPVKILSKIDSSVTFSPDGKQIAFRRIFDANVDSAIIIANSDGTNQRELVHPILSGDNFFQADLAWSPDGKRIVSTLATAKLSKRSLIEISVEDGSIKPINQDNWIDFGRPVWLPDGSGILIPAQAKGTQNQQIYLFSYPGGEARRITNDTNYYSDLSLSADATTLVTTQRTTDLNLWTLPIAGGAAQNSESQARKITDSGNHVNGIGGLAVSPDSRIVYTSKVNGNSVLWVCNADGTNPKRLAEEVFLWKPAISSDGRYIVVTIGAKNGDNEDIWRMNADGSNLVKLTNGEADEGSSITPDDRWVVYANFDGGKGNVKKVPIEGGDAVSVLEKHFEIPRVSPDGKWILGWYEENENGDYKDAIFPSGDAGGEQKIKKLDIPNLDTTNWSPDSKSIAYVTYDDNRTNLWMLPIAGGKPQRLTDFKSQYIAEFAFAPDGKSIALSRGTETNDAVLISNFK